SRSARSVPPADGALARKRETDGPPDGTILPSLPPGKSAALDLLKARLAPLAGDLLEDAGGQRGPRRLAARRRPAAPGRHRRDQLPAVQGFPALAQNLSRRIQRTELGRHRWWPPRGRRRESGGIYRCRRRPR